jgi:hypothetical protein
MTTALATATTAPAAPRELPPAHRGFISQLGRAAADLVRARDTAAQALDAPGTPGELNRALGFAHKATGRLHETVANAPAFEGGGNPVSLVTRAIRDASAGITELDRALGGKPVAITAVRDAWNSAVHSIGTAQNLVKYPPTDVVYDGS